MASAAGDGGDKRGGDKRGGEKSEGGSGGSGNQALYKVAEFFQLVLGPHAAGLPTNDDE
jgi:hypothetical protein